MRILVIGGTGFIGPHLVRRLDAMGHQVAVLHRGQHHNDLPVEHIRGERRDLRRLAPRADVVIDLILSSAAQARETMETFRGVSQRVVAASSCDVYRACGILHGSEPGPPDPVPLTENSPLRAKLQTYPPEQIAKVRDFYPWVDDEYDKIPVERTILGDAELAGTVCRLPMIYGPEDPAVRFFPILRRVVDGRPVVFSESVAAWKAPRGYVENVAEAIALAATDARAAGRIFNVAETPSFTELEWARKVAAATGSKYEVIALTDDRAPKHLSPPGNFAQHWTVDSWRIRRELGYREPVSIDEGIRRTVAWDLEHLPAAFPMYPLDYAAEDAALASRFNASS
jgi:nucleoside-diphosphate-sugar epimerase